MTDQHPVLVTGATGAQGGATIDALLDATIPVRALVRDPQSASSLALAGRGVMLVQGDFEDEGSLARAAEGARAVFSVQLPPRPDDAESEVRTGRKLIEAAKAAGIEVFVHTSVARAGDQATFIDWDTGRWWPGYWNSKSQVNDLVRQAGFAHWVILKPAYMMDNFILPKVRWMHPSLVRGALEAAMAPQARLDLIAASDVGRFAAAAIVDPARFDRQEIDLAADSLTMAEVAAIFAEVSGKPVIAKTVGTDEMLASGVSPGLVESQQWASAEGYKVDLNRADAHGIALEHFYDWLRRHRDHLDIESA